MTDRREEVLVEVLFNLVWDATPIGLFMWTVGVMLMGTPLAP